MRVVVLMGEQGTDYISINDLEARLMRHPINGRNIAYNIQHASN